MQKDHLPGFTLLEGYSSPLVMGRLESQTWNCALNTRPLLAVGLHTTGFLVAAGQAESLKEGGQASRFLPGHLVVIAPPV